MCAMCHELRWCTDSRSSLTVRLLLIVRNSDAANNPGLKTNKLYSGINFSDLIVTLNVGRLCTRSWTGF